MQAVSIPQSGSRVGKMHLFREGNVIPCSAANGGPGGGARCAGPQTHGPHDPGHTPTTNAVLTYVVGVKRNLVRVYASMTRRKWGILHPSPYLVKYTVARTWA